MATLDLSKSGYGVEVFVVKQQHPIKAK